MTALATTDTATLQAMLVDLRARYQRYLIAEMHDFASDCRDQIQEIQAELDRRHS
jgi:hypothetical protein